MKTIQIISTPQAKPWNAVETIGYFLFGYPYLVPEIAYLYTCKEWLKIIGASYK